MKISTESDDFIFDEIHRRDRLKDEEFEDEMKEDQNENEFKDELNNYDREVLNLTNHSINRFSPM